MDSENSMQRDYAPGRSRRLLLILLSVGSAVAANNAIAAQAEPAGGVTGQGQSADDAPNVPASDAPRVYGPTMPTAVQASHTMPVPAWGGAPAGVPPALTDALNLSTHYNPAVVAAWATVRAMHADLSNVRWQRLPSLSTGYNQYSAGAYAHYPSVTVNMPVATFGRIGAQIDRAKAQQAIAIGAWRLKVIEIAVQTEQSYFQVIAATRKQKILDEGAKEHLRLVESMARRVVEGVSPHADLLLARSRLEQIQSDLEAVNAQRLTALRNLSELLQGHPLGLGAVPTYDPKANDADWDGAEEQAVVYSPAREQALATADSARDDITAAKASLFPELDAQYSYDPIYGSRVGLALKLQASGGLSQFSRITAAQDRFDAALAQVRDVERQVRQQVDDQVVANHSARTQASISADVASTAREVSDSYERQFIAGHRSWLDVMNALREDINTRLTKVTAEVTAMDTAAQLMLETGRWQPSLAEENSK